MPTARKAKTVASGVVPTESASDTPRTRIDVAQWDAIGVFLDITRGLAAQLTVRLDALGPDGERYRTQRVSEGTASNDEARVALSASTERVHLTFDTRGLSEAELVAWVDNASGSDALDAHVLGYALGSAKTDTEI